MRENPGKNKDDSRECDRLRIRKPITRPAKGRFKPKRPTEVQGQAAENVFSVLGSWWGGKEGLTADAYSGLEKIRKEPELV